MIAHVFVDAENIPPSVTFKVVEHFGKEHTITKVDIVAKEDTLPYKYRNLDEKIYRVQNCFYGKNSADTWLCFEMVRAIIDEPDLELIIIVSSDKDFLPAIKFAVDFEKKIFIVSNGAGHRTLAEQLKILNVNPDAVELKDFRLNFGEVPQKLEKFLPHFSFEIKKYFFDREDRIKFILVKKDNRIFEVPFIAGMTTYIFRRVLRELNILVKGNSIRDFVSENFLKLSRNKIYFRSETEISELTPADLIEEYFAEHVADTIKIFIKHSSNLYEIPFVNGMPLELFGKLLREKNIIGKNASPAQTAANSLLKVVEGKVYLCGEDEQANAFEDAIKNVDEYFSFHGAEVRKVFIKHNGKTSEIPFVNGMPLELFGKLLREKNIIGKNASPAQTAANSLLKVVEGKVYLRDEDEQANAFEDAIKNVDEYFSFHAAEVRKVFIKHNGKTSEIPFVNGMPLELFGKLLREKNITGKITSATRIAKKNFLDVREGKVFLCDEDRLTELYAESTGNLDAYFEYHEDDKINIFVKHNGNIFEIPFVDGMPLILFDKFLHARKIIGKNSSAKKVALNSLLEIHDERVFQIAEEELAAAQDDLETNVDEYFNAHALNIKSIFIRHAEKNFSIPFVEGMPIKVFSKLLRERKIIDRKISPEKIIASNSLIMRDKKIFVVKGDNK